MASNSLSLLVVVFSILLASASTEAALGLGGWHPIKNVTDPKVVEIAEFAVKQHNNMHVNDMLRLVSVVKGETQIVNGINYRLVVSVTNAVEEAMLESNYKVVVLDKPWMKERNLTSFEKIPA